MQHDERGDHREIRRSPHGERGLKFGGGREGGDQCGRSPHGERGLKFLSIITSYIKV